MNKSSKVLKHPVIGSLLQAIIGCFFVFSAVTKLQSADWFELYIYSLEYFPFDFSSVLSRFIIGFELLVGMLWLSLHFKRLTYRLTLITLLVFSIYLIVEILGGQTENCFCFGTYLPLTPKESLFKNLLLIVLIVASRWGRTFSYRLNPKLSLLLGMALIVTPFIISPPDIFLLTGKDTKQTALPDEKISLSDSTLSINTGKKVVAFYSTNCKFCVMSAQRISIIAKQLDIADDIRFVFWGDANYLDSFWEKSNALPFEHVVLPFAELEKITGGRFPTIYFLQDGIPWHKTNYRDMEERHFAEFFAL